MNYCLGWVLLSFKKIYWRWQKVCLKKCARKMVNSYRMFIALTWSMAGTGKGTGRGEGFQAQHELLKLRQGFNSGSRPAICNWSCSKGEAAKSSTCENEAKGAQRRPSTALFSDQYSELNDEVTRVVNIPTESNLLPIETLSLLVVWRYVASIVSHPVSVTSRF